MSTLTRAARLLPWCELAEIEWLAGDPVKAERLMREGMWAARGCTCAQSAAENGHDAHWWRVMFGCDACSHNASYQLMFDAGQVAA